MSSIYLSGWSPRNTPRTWDRTSISNSDAEFMLGKYGVRKPGKVVVGAVAWTDTRGSLRMMCCDLADDRRITLRMRGSDWSVEIVPEGALA